MTNHLSRQMDRNEPVQAGGDQAVATAVEQRFVMPRASVFETQDAVMLDLEMPGVSRETIDVTLERDELVVTGRRKTEDYDKCEVLHQERSANSFRRSFVLSERIDGNRIAAKYENGILHLTLPKSEDLKPKKITIE